MIELPTDRFVPSPAQGALAVQTRTDGEAIEIIRVLDDSVSRTRVEAERSFLRRINAGCHTPVGALAQIDDEGVTLNGQLFDDSGERMVEGTESGCDASALGVALADRLVATLRG